VVPAGEQGLGGRSARAGINTVLDLIRILPEEHRPKVFSSRNPHSVPTFLVDGAVAGSWRYVDGRIDLTEFDPLPRGVRRQVERAARDLTAFHA